MKGNVIIGALLLSITSFSSIGMSEEDKTTISNTIKQLATENKLVGTHMLAVVDQNGLVLFTGYTKENKAFTADTPFLLASHTKAMTSTLFAILADQGQLDLNAPLGTYDANPIATPKVDTSAITIKQLLTHTAGFTSVQHSFKTAFLGFEDQVDLVASLNNKVLVAPDYSFRYSNTGPIVASMIAEEKLEKSWSELMDEHLFSALGMHNTTTRISEVKNILPGITSARNGDVFAYGHHKVDKTMHPAGGVVSTMGDMAIWLKANINRDYSPLADHDIFTALHNTQVKQSKEYFTYSRDGYTLGWDSASYNGERLLTRFGNYGGYSVHVSFMPEQKLGIIAMTNLDTAYVLPHVMANFAYNTLLKKDNAQQNLTAEKERLTKSIEKERASAPDLSHIVRGEALNPDLLGTYNNNEAWPNMHFYVDKGQVKVKWGELTGTLLKNEEQYYANFGVLERPISFSPAGAQAYSLTNGSLKYSQLK
ncbi:serine hydrolase domain-containing protein [Pseudoalteromonas sp. BDTF-M6]|uniref:serine hydrolase domain-containing protein n=1 Tax=Pseudoalteromonas sp. BDTF-M6 TaxID=2796132 RepID=UPI001BAFEC4A|nr:serine hydrolase domain-containing protein [Pseudoalteromonas sp. BDTF-M6]MBS3797036.1 beta-lactamase family protein [Pseudoalteromonas sp. BDTF-M6]